MLFSSISFLYYFFAAVLLLYFIVPFKFKIFKKKNGEWVYFEAKNFVLFLASFFFYFYGEPIYTILMVATTVSSYIHGLLIDKFRGKTLSKVFLWTSIISSIGVLGFFKYSDFFISNINEIFSSNINLLKLALPIGISFYTFQILSYNIDVYRGEVKAQRNPINLAAYITMFPQLIAGPIVRYKDVAVQLESREHNISKVADGIRRFVFGLSKKILIANVLGEMCEGFRLSDDKSVLFYWMYAIANMLQIYFDLYQVNLLYLIAIVHL